MVHIPSTSKRPVGILSREQQRLLLQVARASILRGLQEGKALEPDPADYETVLTSKLACFITLEKHGNLRGCIGHLQAIQPLIIDVAENAFAAAFRDPRFPPLSEDEFPQLQLHISILSAAEPISFDSEQDLISQIRPGQDGLILQDGNQRGTFLPSVWESLPRTEDFLAHLKTKAGLPVDHWSDSLKVFRYTTESFGA